MRYWDAQRALFRCGDPNAIRDQERAIRAEWKKAKVYLSPRQFKAIIAIGKTVAESIVEAVDGDSTCCFPKIRPRRHARRGATRTGPSANFRRSATP